MNIVVITGLLFGSMILALGLGLPVAFALGGIGTIFILFLWGPEGLSLVALRASGMMRSITLVAVPLFILMASVLAKSGVVEDLYDAMHRWAGPVRGGLLIGSIIICAIIAAMSGIAATGTVTMGLIALPALLKRGYDKKLTLGAIMAGGALGPLIPPSVIMIVYGSVSGLSVGKLFLGGIIPGVMLAVLFIIYIGIRCYFNPSLGPPLPVEERADWQQKLVSLRAVILPLLVIASVLGSIFGGLATATEASAAGAVAAIVCAAIHRRFSWSLIKDAGIETLKTTCMIMWILFGAQLFAAVYQGLGASKFVDVLLTLVPLSGLGVLVFIQLVFFILGCLVDALSILMITYPIFFPLIARFGYDPMWFAILFCINTQMGYLTPPFGANLFFMKGVAPKDTTIEELYRSIIPFVALQAIVLFLTIVFPQLATWVPYHGGNY